jgi:hypothetical protein
MNIGVNAWGILKLSDQLHVTSPKSLQHFKKTIFVCKTLEGMGHTRVTSGANVLKLFTAVSYEFCNNLERLSLASFSRLVQCSQVRLEPTHWAQALLSSITLGWKGLLRTNT